MLRTRSPRSCYNVALQKVDLETRVAIYRIFLRRPDLSALAMRLLAVSQYL